MGDRVLDKQLAQPAREQQVEREVNRNYRPEAVGRVAERVAMKLSFRSSTNRVLRKAKANLGVVLLNVGIADARSSTCRDLQLPLRAMA
jgi:hypothetical protein